MGLGTDSLIHQRLFPDLRGYFYPTVAQLQSKTVTHQANGELRETWTTTRVLRGNLSASSSEVQREVELARTANMWAFLVNGPCPSVTTEHRLIIQSTVYRIEGIVHDSLGESTRIDLERVTQ